MSRWQLALTEYYFPPRHYYDPNLDSSLLDETAYINSKHIMALYLPTRYNSINITDMNRCIRIYEYWANERYGDGFKSVSHPIIRNFNIIMQKRRSMEINLVVSYTNPDGTTMCVLKTFWLRCFQRKWRDRQKKIKYLRCLNNLKNREIGCYFPK